MSVVRGARVEGPDAEHVAARLTPLIEDMLPPDTDAVVVLPDTHYPFHPSTGLVTAPATVEATVSALGSIAPEATVTLAHAGGRFLAPELTAEFLGYPGLAERLGVELLSLAEADTVSHVASVSGADVSIELPRPLAEAPVLHVPTLRRSPAFEVVAGMGNLAGAVIPDREPSIEEVIAATTAVAPALTILDGVRVFPGVPNRLDVVLASRDAASVDLAIARELLGGVADDYFDPFRGRTVEITGVSLPELGADLHVDDVSAGGPGDRVKAAYRLYTRLSDDAVPPQFMS